MIPDYTEELESKITKNADKLISTGFKSWSKGKSSKKSKSKSKKDQQDQLRDIEEKIVEDEVGKGTQTNYIRK